MFEDGVFEGTVVSKDVDKATGEIMYHIHYDDDDKEDVSEKELRNILIDDETKEHVTYVAVRSSHTQFKITQ